MEALQQAANQGAEVTARIRFGSSAEDIRITAPNVSLETLPDYMTKRCVLFHYPETEALAREIAQASDGRVDLGEVKWA